MSYLSICTEISRLALLMHEEMQYLIDYISYYVHKLISIVLLSRSFNDTFLMYCTIFILVWHFYVYTALTNVCGCGWHSICNGSCDPVMNQQSLHYSCKCPPRLFVHFLTSFVTHQWSAQTLVLMVFILFICSHVISYSKWWGTKTSYFINLCSTDLLDNLVVLINFSWELFIPFRLGFCQPCNLEKIGIRNKIVYNHISLCGPV